MASRFCYGRLISICFITTLLGFIFQLWPVFTASSQLPAKFNASRMPTVSLEIGIKQYSSSTKLTYDEDFVIRRCQLNLVVNRWMQQKTTRPKICFPEEDRHSYEAIRQQGNDEEKDQQMLFNKIFPRFPNAAFVDMGAFAGAYTISAALLGRKVFAFEPMPSTFKALYHSVAVNGLQDRVQVFNYAAMEASYCASSVREDGRFINPSSAIMLKDDLCTGAIRTGTVDDLLLPVFKQMNLKEAIFKMDIQGSEANAFAGAGKFLKEVKVSAILMEWIMVTKYIRDRKDSIGQLGYDDNKRQLIMDMLSTLKQFYDPFSATSLAKLKYADQSRWPLNVLFIKKDSKALYTK